jgi:hypothetical protein
MGMGHTDVHWCRGVEHDVHRLSDPHSIDILYESQSDQWSAAAAMAVCQNIPKSIKPLRTDLSIRNAKQPPWSIPAPFNMPKRLVSTR